MLTHYERAPRRQGNLINKKKTKKLCVLASLREIVFESASDAALVA